MIAFAAVLVSVAVWVSAPRYQMIPTGNNVVVRFDLQRGGTKVYMVGPPYAVESAKDMKLGLYEIR
ncbi:MAG: hypothetical protein HY614_06695 [Candidatus Rokubacteria bacterium]|nr:hypothetical protein [Candidatus Rokubacteria bacterium]